MQQKLDFQLEGQQEWITRSHRYSEYIELQYWGPLTLDDVHTFVFRTQPPSGSFLKALLDRNIKILDGSQRGPFAPWSNKE